MPASPSTKPRRVQGARDAADRHPRRIGAAVPAARERHRLARHRLAGVLPAHQGRPARRVRARRRRPRRDAAGVRQRARTTSSSAPIRASGMPAASTSTSSASGLRLRTQSLATHPARRHRVPGARRTMPARQPQENAEFRAGQRRSCRHEAARRPVADAACCTSTSRCAAWRQASPVDFRGVEIGEVKSIGVQFDRAQRAFKMPVLVQVYPDRLRRRAEGPGFPNPATRRRSACACWSARACARNCAPATC